MSELEKFSVSFVDGSGLKIEQVATVKSSFLELNMTPDDASSEALQQVIKALDSAREKRKTRVGGVSKPSRALYTFEAKATE